jgi:hypothetical protein
MLNNKGIFNSTSIWDEEAHFLSDLYSQGVLIATGIKSKLILNRMKYAEPLLLLYPAREKLEDIDTHFEIEIRGYSEFLGGGISTEIHIPKAYVMHSQSTVFASSWQESSIEVIPDEIYKKHYLRDQEDQIPEKAWVTFILTKNNMIGPWGTTKMSFTGEVKRNFKPRVVLNFGNDWVGTFERHYKYIDTKTEGIGGYFSSYNLVFNLKRVGNPISSLEEIHLISDLLDKLLLYVSFVTRQRTMWVAWTSKIENQLIEYYRNIFIPSKINEYDEPLIPEQLIEEFLKHCLAYITSEENLDLYLPLVYVVSANKPGKTAMSLEALLHLYSKKKDKTKHFKTPDDWKNFKTHIEKALDGFQFFNNDIRDEMLKKIGIFNQISINSLYYDFCKTFQIDNSDLWPVFGSGLSLYNIRNKLIHGIQSGDKLFLIYANTHLKWIVERYLLAMIGWVGYGKESNVDSDTLCKYNPYREWKQYYGRLATE